MIVSIGIDIIEVYRIGRAIARTPRFAAKVYTVAEREYCDAKRSAAPASYAGRFAAKEAFLKAIKTGWRGKISWHDVEIAADESGAPSLKLSGEALSIFERIGGKRIHLSIAHTSEYAVAEVIIEG